MAYQSSLKGGNLLKFSDLKVGMEITSLTHNQVEIIRKINFEYGMFLTKEGLYWRSEFGHRWVFYISETDDTTQLELSDYQSLLELAVELNDKPWFDEICATINGLKESEQHA